MPDNKKILKGKRVLVVEYDVATIEQINKILIGEEVDVTNARNGFLALQEVNRQPFDLVLVQTAIPKVDGFQVAKSAKGSRVNGQTPLVLLADSDAFDQSLVKKHKVTGILKTPINLDQFLGTVVDWINPKKVEDPFLIKAAAGCIKSILASYLPTSKSHSPSKHYYSHIS